MRIKHLFLFGLIFLVTACQKEPIYQQPEINFTESYESHEEITGEQAKDVVNFLDQTISSKNLKLGKLNLPFDKNLIDKKTIVKVEDSATGLINYTFGVKREESDNFLFQVVVTEFENQQYSEPYIFKYTFDDAFRKKLNKGAADWSEYKWPIYPYSLSAAQETLSKSEPCPTIYPSPSSGGTGSTGGGTSGSGSSSGGSSGSGGSQTSPCVFWTTYELTNVDWVDPDDHSQGWYSADQVAILNIDCEGGGPQALLGDYDCPNAPDAPIGVNDPDRLEDLEHMDLLAVQEYLENAIADKGRSTWSRNQLKDDPWFKDLVKDAIIKVSRLRKRPAVYEQFKGTENDPWPDIATAMFVSDYAARGLAAALGNIASDNFVQTFDNLSTVIVNAYVDTKASLPTTPEGWADLGLAVSGTLAYELAGILNPAVGAAQSLQGAWEAMDQGSKLLAAGLVVAAIAEFVPWTKVAKAILKVGDVAITSIKNLKVWKIMQNAGLPPAVRNNVGALKALNKSKGSRPNPSTYLNSSYISNHLAKFKNGVVKFSANTPNGSIGPPSGTFVLPKSQADGLIQQANGDVGKLEKLLGLDPGDLGTNPVRIDINSPSGTRMPSGNELGANQNWIPGGKTTGGIDEAVVDQIQPGTYVSTSIF